MILPALDVFRRLRGHIDTRTSFIADYSYDCRSNAYDTTPDSTSRADSIFRSFKEVMSSVDNSEMIWGKDLLTIDGEKLDPSSAYNICDAISMNLLEKGSFQLDIELSA